LWEGRWYNIITETTPDPRAWHSAFWIFVEGIAFFAIFGGASRKGVYGSVLMFDYESVDWFEPPITGDSLIARYGHISAVVDHCIYIIGGRRKGNTLPDPIRIDLSTQPFRAEIIPQADEPEVFHFGSCSVTEFGIALYGGLPDGPPRGLWEIRLRPETAVSSSQSRLIKPKALLSRPGLSAKAGVVTVAIGKEKVAPFEAVFDPLKMDTITKRIGGVYHWRRSMLVSMTDEDEDNEMILEDDEFRSDDRVDVPTVMRSSRPRAMTRSLKPNTIALVEGIEDDGFDEVKPRVGLGDKTATAPLAPTRRKRTVRLGSMGGG
jgi:hypothetical protein